jgi:CheY-like chemotaxis protein
MARVLVVDDDDAIRDALVEALVDAGYRVAEAPNGRDALDAMRAAPPCLVLLDLMMPIMTGWDVLQEMQRDVALASIPVCVVSANPHGLPRVACVLPKPISLDRLLDVVRSHCAA